MVAHRTVLTEASILRRMEELELLPMRSRRLARELAISEEQYRAFSKLLKKMVRSGKLALLKGGRYSLPVPENSLPDTASSGGARRGKGETPAGEGNRVEGRIQVKAAGFGFVSIPGMEDVYIPPHAVADAADGDLVAVSISRGGRRGRKRGPAGRVVEVLERSRTAFAGVFKKAASGGKGKQGGVVLLGRGSSIEAVYVPPDAGAGAEDGDKVLVEVERFPRGQAEAVGRVTKRFGKAGTWKTEAEAIIAELGLQTDFSKESLAEAEDLESGISPQERACRTDYTRQLTVTIDPESAKDFDDAVSVERRNGTWRLYVHIADASVRVRVGGPLDNEARLRTTSVYMPGRTIPMLPPRLSTDLCCLRQGAERLTKTVRIDYDTEGNRLETRIERSIVKSARRLSYPQVREAFENPSRSRLPQEILRMLRDLREVTELIRSRRVAGGSIDIDMPEVKLLLDQNGEMEGIGKEEYDFSHKMIEDSMLEANCVVAEYMAGRGLPGLYRVHEEPGEDALDEFAQFARSLGFKIRRPYTRRNLQRVVEAAAGTPFLFAVQVSLLRSMKQALYLERPADHWALSFPLYCHFTSPIRRYPDLLVHRVLDGSFPEGKSGVRVGRRVSGSWVASAEAGGVSSLDLAHVAAHCSERERAAEKAERRLLKFRQIEYLHKHGVEGEVLEGTVTGASAAGVFVEVEKYLLEGLIPREELPEGMRFDRKRKCYVMRGKRGKKRAGSTETREGIRLGDRVRVVLLHIDLEEPAVRFRLVPRSK